MPTSVLRAPEEEQQHVSAARALAPQAPVSGQRNRGRVLDLGAGVLTPAPARNPIDRAENLLRNKGKFLGQKMRLFGTDPEVTITPPSPGSDVFVTGGLDIKPARKGLPKAAWDSKPGQAARGVTTTVLQTALSGVYTMLGWTEEILLKYLKGGWYDFAFKTLFLHEMLGSVGRVLERAINGFDPLTNEEKQRRAAAAYQSQNRGMFVDAATRRRGQLAQRPSPEMEVAMQQTLRNLDAARFPMTETAPDVPRHAVVPTNDEMDARRLLPSGAGVSAPASPDHYRERLAQNAGQNTSRNRDVSGNYSRGRNSGFDR